MNQSANGPETLDAMIARLWLLRGTVQGSGVRPAVLRWAATCGLRGIVGNTGEGVEARLEGAACQQQQFRAELTGHLPAGCEMQTIEEHAVDWHGYAGLTLAGYDDRRSTARSSEAISDEGGSEDRRTRVSPLATPVPLDRRVCDACLHEMTDAGNRRRGYAWISCATCGPRYSLVTRMPFERPDTAMRSFRMCHACAEEYRSMDDRRLHAQTIGCQECGPRWWAVDARGVRHEGLVRARPRGDSWRGDSRGEKPVVDPSDDALSLAVRLLTGGRILALRGVGGYQLLCDATDEQAVRRLRERKARPTKPFAVLVEDLEAARRIARWGPGEEEQLLSAASPIVIVPARVDSPLAASVHPRLREVGLMLPTTGMHALLLEATGRPLVCTSANGAGEPLLYRIDDAENGLAGIADGWLHHDREIAHPIDDSVVRCVAGRPMALRLGRGLAPLPLELPSRIPRLAVGAHLKSAVAWSNGRQAALGPHVGDLETLAARERFRERCDAHLALYDCWPTEILHDAHPDYATTREAQRRASEALARHGSAVSLRAVQHHRAHVAAAILEHQLWNTPVLGVAWDGSGHGGDGVVWGGEFLRVDEFGQWTHVGRWRPLELPGGDVAVREPWRVAVAVLRQAVPVDEWLPVARRRFAERPLDALLRWLDQAAPIAPTASQRTGEAATRWSMSVARTTSVGRLFDAAAAWVFGVSEVSHEGEAAMWLESSAEDHDEQAYPVSLDDAQGERVELDWRPLFRGLWHDLRRGESAGRMSMRFHRALSQAIIDVSARHARMPVVLSGGVFQNRLLGETLLEMAAAPGRFRLPGWVPTNDGGIAAGQLAYASLRGGA
jgi:hydrogenase maturation protein HypF